MNTVTLYKNIEIVDIDIDTGAGVNDPLSKLELNQIN